MNGDAYGRRERLACDPCPRGGGALDRAREPLPTRIQGLPDLPAPARVALDAGLGALRLDDLRPADRVALADHLRLLLAWNASINLTSIRDPVAAVRGHVLDSLSVVPVLREHAIERFVDLGSGGGFPGLPVAVALPARRALLVESVTKKARFLAVATAALSLQGRVETYPGRAEALAADTRQRDQWPAVLVRAVGPLAELLELGLPLLARRGLLIAWKGPLPEAELAAAERARRVLGAGPARIIEIDVAGLDGHRLVVVDKRDATPPGYPRVPAARRRHPW